MYMHHQIYIHINMHIYTCIYIYIYICTYICICILYNCILYNCIIVYCILITNLDAVLLEHMYPWVTEVGRLLIAGSTSSWFGVWCPAHCSASLPLLASIFIAGFGIGFITALLLLAYIFFPHLNSEPSIPNPSAATPSPSDRLSANLHERGWGTRQGCQTGRSLAPTGR